MKHNECIILPLTVLLPLPFNDLPYHASSWSPELALKDLNCTQESPETCPPTTLCCLNKCYGAINDEENTFTLPSFHCPGQL